ncbi:ribonucleotide reductase of class Ia (aerobic), alpha subunit [Synechococcus phage BUCT-ZZ01]|nr:ribonucleotide reductase of class Ia (aerobic), alpha subunit [Synechococcus phage BUCT-ZZ01]
MSIKEQLSQERKQYQEAGTLPNWFTTAGWQLFKQKYAVEGEEQFRGRAEAIAIKASSYLPEKFMGASRFEWSKKFYNLIWNGWMSCSTPILANMGTERGMSVSCSGVYVGDSVDDFYSALHENAILSKNGFGTSAYLGDIRQRGSKISKGGKASGAFPVFEDQMTMASKISQGGTRRGSVACYLPISHGDFQEVYDYIYDYPDEINVGFNWYDTDTELMDAKDKETVKRFKKLLKLRAVQGKGYLFFPDKANRRAPKMYQDHGLKIHASNLCCEITLFSDKDHTFTCVLAAMNLAKRNEWKDTDAIFVATVFLDCVAQDFIERGSKIKGLEKAVRFTEKGRALGLGVCGYHTYLQQEMIPFESLQAQFFNNNFFKELHDKTLEASKAMAVELGEPEWCKGYGVRNTHRTAMMPTMSTAAIMGGVSQGIEPMIGNCFVADLAGGATERVNPVFLDLMKKRGKYTKKLVREIADNHGSVQHLDWLTDEEKIVFKTAYEINQEVILRKASQRQRWICQGQSLNIFVSANESEKYIAYLHKLAIRDPNILGLYYVRSEAGVEASKGMCVACQ